MRFDAVPTSDLRSSRDREVIRIDHASDHMGIAAALRRAFSDASTEPCARDFEDLLHKLR